MAKETLYYVRFRPMTYGDPPMQLDHGQVFELQGQRLDARLAELKYIEKVKDPRTVETCGKCGARFVAAGFLTAHGDARHKRTEGPDFDAIRQPQSGGLLDSLGTGEIGGEMLVDVTGDAEDRRLERDFPLAWEKTAASQKG